MIFLNGLRDLIFLWRNSRKAAMNHTSFRFQVAFIALTDLYHSLFFEVLRLITLLSSH